MPVEDGVRDPECPRVVALIVTLTPAGVSITGARASSRPVPVERSPPVAAGILLRDSLENLGDMGGADRIAGVPAGEPARFDHVVGLMAAETFAGGS